MKVSGEATLHAPIGEVWAALNDPAVLVRTIPGCERLEATGPDAYSMVVTAGVASIKGVYTGEVILCEKHEPCSFLMKASGAGGAGTVSTEVRVTLDDVGDGSTRLSYDADAVIGGAVAGVGQRMLVGVSKKTAAEFFKSVDAMLTGTATPSVAAELAPAEAGVFVAASKPTRASTLGGGGDGFLVGALAGAAIALAGVLVGGVLRRRY